MAPSALHIKNGFVMDEDDYYGINKGDRKVPDICGCSVADPIL
jgi:hypothetical protein